MMRCGRSRAHGIGSRRRGRAVAHDRAGENDQVLRVQHEPANSRGLQVEEVREELRLRPPDEKRQGLQQEGDPDSSDQRRDPGGGPERTIGQSLDQHAEERAENHRDGEERREAQGAPRLLEAHPPADGQADEGADHVHVAVGEIDEAENAVDHRVADGDESVDGARLHSDDQVLDKSLHSWRGIRKRPSPAPGERGERGLTRIMHQCAGTRGG